MNRRTIGSEKQDYAVGSVTMACRQRTCARFVAIVCFVAACSGCRPVTPNQINEDTAESSPVEDRVIEDSLLERLHRVYGGFSAYQEMKDDESGETQLRVLLPFVSDRHSFLMTVTESEDRQRRSCTINLIARLTPAYYHLELNSEGKIDYGDPVISRTLTGSECEALVDGLSVSLLSEMLIEATKRRWIPKSESPELKLYD
jgi:hypothetical protein